jgi:phosphatidylethanolamine-binding protein (PEBP) family uncharacterized protein
MEVPCDDLFGDAAPLSLISLGGFRHWTVWKIPTAVASASTALAEDSRVPILVSISKYRWSASVGGSEA